MKKENKMIIGGIIVVLVAVIVVVVIFAMKNNDDTSNSDDNDYIAGTTYNQNEAFLVDQEIDGLSFTNVSCSYDGSFSIISYTISNTTSNTIHLSSFQMIIRDEEGNIMATFDLNFDYDLSPSEEYATANSIDIDLTNAYTIEYNFDNDTDVE